MDTPAHPLQTLLRTVQAAWLVVSPNRERACAATTEPADLGTAFGLDAAIEAGDDGAATLAS